MRQLRRTLGRRDVPHDVLPTADEGPGTGVVFGSTPELAEAGPTPDGGESADPYPEAGCDLVPRPGDREL